MASVRFICGTQSVYKVLEDRLSDLLRTEETILFSSCFDANGAVFETLLDEEDVVISDELNHASIIDGIRLSKARRSRYANCDLGDLEEQRVRARRGGARRMLIVTDGVFSMDGAIAPLQGIVELADEYEALVMVDDSHATGFIGATGAGTHEQFGVLDRIDILTGTLGKALGGASGGYVSGRAEVVAVLRQRARPYLFSNSLAPCIAAATLTALDLVRAGDGRRAQLRRNTKRFRNAMQAASFQIGGLEHPIAPVMFGSAARARQVAERLADEGIYAIAFAHPVVPKDKARIRVQLSAAHTDDDIDEVVRAFAAAVAV